MEIFLAGEDGAPGRLATGTVVEGTGDAAAGRIGGGAEKLVAGGGAGYFHGCKGGDATAVAAAGEGAPIAATITHDFEDRESVGVQFNVGHGLGLRGVGPVLEHQLGVGVLVIDGDESVVGIGNVVSGKGEEVEPIVVVAELFGLGFGGLVVGVKGR
jgi:hypothetical protein